VSDHPITTLAFLFLLATLVCAGEWSCTRVFCDDPVWGGTKLGWTCIGS
jgi:DMSO/TMAO reductase YedYZ molybdopterin-dependent catalytic subunit